MRKTLYLKFVLGYLIFGFFRIFSRSDVRFQYDAGASETGKGGLPL